MRSRIMRGASRLKRLVSIFALAAFLDAFDAIPLLPASDINNTT
jgi:hypothetical protein